ncbi:hypothetical protein V2J09_016314 [Rumex salicifolius]
MLIRAFLSPKISLYHVMLLWCRRSPKRGQRIQSQLPKPKHVKASSTSSALPKSLRMMMILMKILLRSFSIKWSRIIKLVLLTKDDCINRIYTGFGVILR